MFKRFTERARRVIILAREEAELYRHEYLGTEHILQGVIKDGGGIAVAIVQKSGVVHSDREFQEGCVVLDANPRRKVGKSCS